MFFRDGKLIPFDEFVGSNDALDFFKSQGVDTSQGIAPLRSAWENVPEVQDFLGKRQDFHFNETLRREASNSIEGIFGRPDSNPASADYSTRYKVPRAKEALFRMNPEFRQINDIENPTFLGLPYNKAITNWNGDPITDKAEGLTAQFNQLSFVKGTYSEPVLPSQRWAASANYRSRGMPDDESMHGKPLKNFAIVHGAKTGDLDWGETMPSQEVEALKDAYITCCYPNQVQEKYPFLKVEQNQSDLPTFFRAFRPSNIGNEVHNFRPTILAHSAILPVGSEQAREKVSRASKIGFGLTSTVTEFEDVLTGKKPALLHSGDFLDFRKSLLNSSSSDDPTPVRLAQLAKTKIEDGTLAKREISIGGEFLENAGSAFITGNPETVQKIEELFEKYKHLDLQSLLGDNVLGSRNEVRSTAWTPEIDKFERELGGLLGYSEGGIDLHSFMREKGLDPNKLPVYPHNPFQIDGPDDKRIENTVGSVRDAVFHGLSPEDIKTNIIQNSREIAKVADNAGERVVHSSRASALRAKFAEGTGTIDSLEGVFGADTVKRLAKISKIGGLALALGIGVPAVASASTGVSPTDGGLGSTLAVGAGVVTVGAVGAYSYSKLRKAGASPRVTGGGAAGAAGPAAGGAAGAAGAVGGGAAAGAAGTVNRNRGSRIYNSAFVQEELDLTTRGFFAGIGSVINDFGFNRRTGSFDTSGKPDSFIDSLFGKALKQDGYVHPVFRKEEAYWRIATNLDDAYQGWKSYINASYQNSSGLSKLFQGVRYHSFKALDSVGGGWLNKQLVKAGGFSTLIAPALMAQGGLSDFKEGYRRGGLVGGAFKTVTGLVSGLVQNKVIAGILLNPGTGLLGAGITAAAGYTAFKIFDVRNKGADYIRSGRMGGLSWNRGPTPGMSGSMAATARQRALNSMENSKFNAMKAMGNESYMMNAPRSRYANSTAIHGITPVLSY
jgi:hypothetical protein